MVLRNFEWGVHWKPSEILQSMLEALKEDEERTNDQVHALAFCLGQVCALEATTTLKLHGKGHPTDNSDQDPSASQRS